MSHWQCFQLRLLLLIIIGGSSHAIGQSVDIITIALEGDDAPGASSRFESFSFPLIDDQDNIVFKAFTDAHLSGSNPATEGLWLSSFGGLSPISVAGDFAPGLVGDDTTYIHRTYDGFNFSANRNLVFGGEIVDESGAIFETSLFSGFFGESPLLLADSSEFPFSASSNPTLSFLQLFDVAQNENGDFAIGALGLVESSAAFLSAIYTGNVFSQNVSDFVETNSTAPVSSDRAFEGFGPAVINPNGDIAFQATVEPIVVDPTFIFSGIFLNNSNGLNVLANNGDFALGFSHPDTAEPFFFDGLNDPTISGNGEVAFSAGLKSDDGFIEQGIWRGSSRGNGLSIVAATGDLRNSEVGEVTFTDIHSTSLAFSNLDELFFVASYSISTESLPLPENPGVQRAIWVQNESSEILPRISEGEAVLGTSFVFHDFPNIAIGSDNRLAFRALLRLDGDNSPGYTGDEGLFIEGGTGIIPIVLTGQQLEVSPGVFKTVVAADFLATGPTEGLSGGYRGGGQITFMAEFSDGSDGLFFATATSISQPPPQEGFIWDGSNCNTTNWHTNCGVVNFNDDQQIDRDSLPGVFDDVRINDATVVIDADPVSINSINASGSLTVNESFDVTATSTIERLVLNSNGVVNAGSTLSLTGASHWESGTLAGNGPIRVEQGATLDSLGNISLESNLDIFGAFFHGDAAVLSVSASNHVTIQNDASYTVESGRISGPANSSLVNLEEFRKLDGDGFTIDIPFINNSGTVILDSGFLELFGASVDFSGNSNVEIFNDGLLQSSGSASFTGSTIFSGRGNAEFIGSVSLEPSALITTTLRLNELDGLDFRDGLVQMNEGSIFDVQAPLNFTRSQITGTGNAPSSASLAVKDHGGFLGIFESDVTNASILANGVVFISDSQLEDVQLATSLGSTVAIGFTNPSSWTATTDGASSVHSEFTQFSFTGTGLFELPDSTFTDSQLSIASGEVQIEFAEFAGLSDISIESGATFSIKEDGAWGTDISAGSGSLLISGAGDFDLNRGSTLSIKQGEVRTNGPGFVWLREGSAIEVRDSAHLLNQGLIALDKADLLFTLGKFLGPAVTNSGSIFWTGGTIGSGLEGSFLEITHTGELIIDGIDEQTLDAGLSNLGTIIQELDSSLRLTETGSIVNNSEYRLQGSVIGGEVYNSEQGEIVTEFNGVEWISSMLTNRGTVRAETGSFFNISGADVSSFSGGTLHSGTWIAEDGAQIFKRESSQIAHTNNAVIEIRGSGAINILPESSCGGSSEFTNNGGIILDGAQWNVPCNLTNRGTLRALNGGIIDINGVFDNSGVASVTDQINSDGTINRGLIKGGSSPGIATIPNAYTQTESGVLEIELGGNQPGIQYDQLIVGGVASFEAGAQIEVKLIDLNDPVDNSSPFVPTSGSRFDIIKAGSFILPDSADLNSLISIQSQSTGLDFELELFVDSSTSTLQLIATERSSINLNGQNLSNPDLQAGTDYLGGTLSGRIEGNASNPPTLQSTIADGSELINVIIGDEAEFAGLDIVIGDSTRFQSESNIPAHIDLHHALSSISNHASDGLENLAAVDLSDDVVLGRAPILEKLQALGDFQVDGVSTLQQKANGNLEWAANGDLLTITPLSVRQAAEGFQAGLSFTDDGAVQLTTEEGREVLSLPTIKELEAFDQLVAGAGFNLEYFSSGTFEVIVPGSNNSFVVRAALNSSLLVGNVATGVSQESHPLISNVPLFVHIYEDDSQIRKQTLYPSPQDWATMKNLIASVSGVESVILGVDGIISILLDGQTYRVVMAYEVSSGGPSRPSASIEPVADANGDGVSDFVIVYPNGNQQLMYLIPPGS